MCPPANPPPPSEGQYWNYEQIFALVNDYKPDSDLPKDVLTDLNPYHYKPSNLPGGIWYLIPSNEKKGSDNGFWKARGEALKIYSNSFITGTRTTLEYFEGLDGQKTDWLMQEYRVTQKESSCKDNSKDSRLLCKVFRCSGPSEIHLHNLTAANEFKKAMEAYGAGGVTELDAKNSNFSPPVLSEHECIQRGDFLELDDLGDPESHSSSSANTSCRSKLSDEYFDTLALLQEIAGEENEAYASRQDSSRYNFTNSVKANDVVLQPASSSMLKSIQVVEDSQPDSATLTEKGEQQISPKGHNSDNSIAGSLTPSTSDKNPEPSEGKKASSSRRMKKFKTYFCFATF